MLTLIINFTHNILLSTKTYKIIIILRFRKVNYFLRFCIIILDMEYRFSKRLKELRLENKLTTTALGEAIGVSDASISRWENGVHDIKGVELFKLAQFFGVSAGYLIGLED